MLLKRPLDIVLSATALMLTCPILLAVAIAVWLDSGGPVLFRQKRMGLRFHPFYILKFRTMRPQADGPVITIAGDSRITRVGKLLRVTKLDELPQLWNVLRGEMSLVGPSSGDSRVRRFIQRALPHCAQRQAWNRGFGEYPFP